MGLFRWLKTRLAFMADLFTSSRGRFAWECMQSLGPELRLRYRKPDPDEDWDMGALLGVIEGHEVCLGCRSASQGSRWSADDITVRLRQPIPGLQLRSEGTSGPTSHPPFDTGDDKFDKTFPQRHALPETAEKFRLNASLRNGLIDFYHKWVTDSGCLTLDDEELETGSCGHAQVPFFPYLPAEDRFVTDRNELATAQKEFLLEMVRLAAKVVEILGNPRYSGVPEEERERRMTLDRELLDVVSDDEDEETLARAKDLLEEGADPDARNDSLESALMLACKAANGAAVALLIERGADVDRTDESGFTPFLHAARGGNAGILRLLLKKGADPHVTDRKQRTALMIAASDDAAFYRTEEELREFFDFLTRCGVDVNAVDREGNTALSYARKNERRMLQEALEKAGARW